MYTSPAYQGYATRDQTATLFGQTMGLVALTAALFALGAYAGRHLSEGAAIVAWIGAFVVLMIMNFAARKSEALAIGLLAVFGAIGYTTRRDLSVIIRFAFFALIALLIFGIVLIFIHIPHGSLIYAIIGLVIFAALTMGDFQRLRRSKDVTSAPLMAASIFLDALNVFLFFLRIFGNGRD